MDDPTFVGPDLVAACWKQLRAILHIWRPAETARGAPCDSNPMDFLLTE
jgi:hypothetical protein